METTLITDPDRIAHIYNTYMKRDFPRNELKPLAAIRRMWNEGRYDCYQMTDARGLIGYAFFVKLAEGGRLWYLVDYLAVAEAYRGQGCGSALLKHLSGLITDADCITLEVEDPEQAQDEEAAAAMRRRLQFYLDNGYRETDVAAQVFGVHYLVLEAPGGRAHSADEIREIYGSLYKSMLPPVMYQAFIKIKGQD